MDSCFKNKRALVTGAGKGIGRGIAIRLAELGAEVVAISRTEADLISLKQQVPSIKTVLHDVTDWDTTKTVVEGLGQFNYLVNNAGIFTTKKFLDFTKDDFDETMNINYRAAFNITQVVARGMIASGCGGSIVNISSDSSIRAFPHEAIYGPSKAALHMLTKELALELGPHNIRINSVKPALLYTNMTRHLLDVKEFTEAEIAKIPLRRLLDIKGVVDSTIFMLSDQSSSMNGTSILLDGGASVTR